MNLDSIEGNLKIRASIDELDRKIKISEERIKYTNDRSTDQIRFRHKNDEMVIDSIKLKLALLNNMAC